MSPSNEKQGGLIAKEASPMEGLVDEVSTAWDDHELFVGDAVEGHHEAGAPAVRVDDVDVDDGH
jgi:hypothetical protein